MPHGGGITESLWRDLIADEVERWLSENEAFDDKKLVEYIRTGEEEDANG